MKWGHRRRSPETSVGTHFKKVSAPSIENVELISELSSFHT